VRITVNLLLFKHEVTWDAGSVIGVEKSIKTPYSDEVHELHSDTQRAPTGFAYVKDET
jgi:hypothetical protein